MTAALNVYGNVREYDTDLDVFGVVFEWPAPQTEPARDGVALDYRTRTHTAGQRTRTVQVSFRGRTANGGPWR
jgi:hypothetical protein